MKTIKIKVPERKHKSTMLKLWNEEYPAQLGFDIAGLDQYLSGLSDASHWFALDDDKIIGWAFKFVRENEKWFAIIINLKFQNKGIGTRLLQEIKISESELNGWVIDHNKYFKQNGSPYLTPISFYLKNDFRLIEDKRLETEKLTAVKIRWSR